MDKRGRAPAADQQVGTAGVRTRKPLGALAWAGTRLDRWSPGQGAEHSTRETVIDPRTSSLC